MQNKKSISLPKVGMQIDTHISQLNNTSYRLGVNVNTSNETGDGLNVQNEPSNYFTTIFPSNYKVIGEKRTEEKTYYFLTSIEQDSNNPNHKRSSIGYIDNNILATFNQDSQTSGCTDCDSSNILDTPLEEITQTPSHTYIELVHDRCISIADIEEKGLNFNINFPIKVIDIKQEKLETVLYWEDWRNPSRYLEVSKIEEALQNNTFDYLHTLDVACSDPIQLDCLNVDKLLLFPKHKRIKLTAKEEQIGGNLKKGTYEFWAAYCDINGNEITEYCTPTNPISVWDENNNILEQTELDEFTNYAIKIQIDNLDTDNFKFYKIAVVERNNVLNTQSVFLAGIYPTTDNIVTYTHSGSNNDDLYITRGNISVKKRMDFSTLTAIKLNIKRAKGSTVTDDRRFIYGLELEEEINIQPVVNLFSSLLHWQTSAANENLYKSFIATSKFKAYSRDEVQPFAIRLLYSDGGYSGAFPFIGRPLLTGEDTIIDDLNSQSVNFSGNSCSVTDRTKKWQIFNTASVYPAPCTDFSNGSIILDPEDIVKTCYINNVAEIPSGSLQVSTENIFYDLKSYIQQHSTDICNPLSEYYNATICSYLEDSYVEECTPYFGDSCAAPSVLSTTNSIGNVLNETVTYEDTDKKPLTDYVKSVPPAYCFPFKTNTQGNYIEDVDFTTTNSLSPCYVSGYTTDFPPEPIYSRRKVFFRDNTFLNENCNYALTINNQTNPVQPGQSVFFNYQGSETETDLYNINSSFLSTPGTGFKSNIHNKAQFFKFDKNNRDKLILEFTSQSGCIGSEDYFELVNNNVIRYTIYEKCSSGATPLKSQIIDLSNPTDLLQEIDTTLFPSVSSFIVAVDCPITTSSVHTDCTDDLTQRDVYYITPPCSCISIYTRDVEYNTLTVNWDSISITKEMTYQATCTYTLPNVSGCDIIPYLKGRMAYWESLNTYDDNKQLYDSSTLKIKPSDLVNLTDLDRDEFILYYTNGLDVDGNYNLKNADFRCKPIRHPKMPDNTIAPYVYNSLAVKNNTDSIIFPLGVNIDSKVVEAMIKVAFTNNLITKKQLDKITGWEILRGDNSIHKSVIASGIVSDFYKYKQEGNDIHFSNFPFNDLGENKFLLDPESNNIIQHPYNGDKNHLFSFLSPDLFLTNPTIPSELSLQGYIFGNSESGFSEVKKHPRWTVLGRDAYTVSEILAAAEVVLEGLLKFTELQIQANQGYWFVGGFTNGTGAAGAATSTGLTAVAIASMGLSAFFKYGEYRYKWLEIFRNLGRTDNFGYFQHSIGRYNKFLKVDNENPNYLRKLFIKKYLKDNYYSTIDESTGENIKINNWNREYSAFLSTGKDFPISYINEYKNFDNNKVNPSTSSNFVNSDVDCELTQDLVRDIASPYVCLKNYIPDQWDNIDSIKWLTTNYIFDLGEDTSCKPIYGGTVCISRFSWRKKVPIFNNNAINLADKLPFKYSLNKNIGKPRFYCDYETDDDAIFNYGSVFPDIRSDYNFDCQTGRNAFYLRPPSKFYLYVHSICDFLVESEINCNFRYNKKQPKDQFYNGQNLSDWLQEVNLPIVEPNTFYYNNTYTFPVSNTSVKFLDKTYDKEVWQKRAFKKNAWIWSEKDNNENSLLDTWKIYKPLNFWEDKTNRGELIALTSIESDQFLGRFENQLILFNQINPYADSINLQNKEIGTGFLYARPINFLTTELGFAGTQHTDFISTPYGYFWVDSKRGRVFNYQKDLNIISENVNGNPSGIKNWFREHLPMKILKYIPNLDIDNKYKGIGFNMWYDDRNSRIFITKRDYVLQNGINKNNFDYDKKSGILKYEEQEVFFDNENIFKDVSWTISYKPEEGTWNSFFTFYPDFSIYHQEFFQSGFNWGQHKETLWSHTLNNKSFCVFQGEYNPWIIEFPITNENVDKILNSLSINIESKRYINQWDYSIHKDIGVTDMFIYNSTNNTGYLVLHPQKTLTDQRKYPYVQDNKQHILTTFNKGKQNVNYFYNRMLNQDNNVPMFKKDENNIFKDVDPRAVRFSGKKVLERMKGEVFIANLSNTQDSRFNIIIKNIINNETINP